jgi:DNA-binding response OmpR family regulator
MEPANAPIRVLIADDDQDLAKALAKYLERHGHAVTLAADGRQALELFQAQPFDVTFMDVRMPTMNGVDSVLEIRRQWPDAKIVMMTGFREAMVTKALEAGALDVLHKPFELREMLAHLPPAAS